MSQLPFHESILVALKQAEEGSNANVAIALIDLIKITKMSKGHDCVITGIQRACQRFSINCNDVIAILTKNGRSLSASYPALDLIIQADRLYNERCHQASDEEKEALYQSVAGHALRYIRYTEDPGALAALEEVLEVSALPGYVAGKFKRKLAHLTKTVPGFQSV